MNLHDIYFEVQAITSDPATIYKNFTLLIGIDNYATFFVEEINWTKTRY